MRRGDTEHHLNELQRWARATATSVDTRDGHKMLRLLLQPPRSLCASTGHYPNLPSWESVQPTTARVPWSRDNFAGRTHSAPHTVATSLWPLPPQARPALCIPPSPQGRVSQSPLISCSFNPILSEWRTDTLRRPTLRGGANPKLNPRSCANKEEKGKSLPSALGAAD